MRIEVEGVDLDALEKVAKEAEDGNWAQIESFEEAFDPPTVRRILTALRAQVERVRVLEERQHHFKDEDWPLALQRLKHTEPGPDQGCAIVGVDDLEFALERLAHFASVAMGNAAEIGRLTARAEAAERRTGELEGLLEEASNAMRMTALAMEAPLGRPTKKHVQHWTSLFHAESQRIRSALLPATQAEGEK